MTHDELLAKIDYYLVPTNKLSGDEGVKNSAIGFMQALRAVVELHNQGNTGECGDMDCCGPTTADICGYCHDEYPCDTIREIIRELK